jgi:hypothetical protein
VKFLIEVEVGVDRPTVMQHPDPSDWIRRFGENIATHLGGYSINIMEPNYAPLKADPWQAPAFLRAKNLPIRTRLIGEIYESQANKESNGL